MVDNTSIHWEAELCEEKVSSKKLPWGTNMSWQKKDQEMHNCWFGGHQCCKEGK